MFNPKQRLGLGGGPTKEEEKFSGNGLGIAERNEVP
jgi:hypothetical protein